MTFIVYRNQVMIILIYLNGSELALVDDVSIAQGADVEPGLPSRIM